MGAGSARPNPKKGAPETENPLCIGFITALRGECLRPWSQKGPDHGVGVDPSFLIDMNPYVGLRLVGVWVGGVWNGHFPESEIMVFILRSFHENPGNSTERVILAKSQAPKFEIQSPKKCNSIPPAIPFHTPTRLPPNIWRANQRQECQSCCDMNYSASGCSYHNLCCLARERIM